MKIVERVTLRSWMMPLALAGLVVSLSTTQTVSYEYGFELGFRNPLNESELSWMAQPGATRYQLLRSTMEDFSESCTPFETFDLDYTDAAEPDPGGFLFYLVRELAPDLGSWGSDSDGITRTVSCMAATGSLVDATGCKDWGGTAETTEPASSQDCIEYRYLGEGRLLLNHVNTAFNCCPEFEAGIEFECDTIVITEDEISGVCDCICLYDLSYEIVNLEPAIYDVRVIQEYVYEDDEPLDFTMDLLSSPSGMHCVERDHYPWW